MNKIRLFLVFVLIIAFTPLTVSAAGEYEIIELYDPNGIVTNIYHQTDDPDGDKITIDVSGTDAVKQITISYGQDSTFTNAGTTATYYVEDYGWQYFNGMSFTCNVYYVGEFYDDSDNLILRAKIHVYGLVDPVCSSQPGGNDNENETCEACAILECPGWGDYMGKIDDIIGAIPPPPNWDIVADTFRDSIAPQIKEDLQDVIGEAPAPPPVPKAPATPTAPTVDVPDLPKPQGQEDEGFKESEFDYDDIKSEAPEIEFREDPTGGFDIGNPVNDLPSQEEFKENVPNEGEAPLPAPPTEQENKAPVPSDTTDTAPIPVEDFDTPPVPSDTTDTAPMPTEDFDTPPTPNEGSNSAPIPNDSGTAPIPTEGFDTPPIPNDTTDAVPMP